MENLLSKYPLLTQLLLTIILFSLALYVSGFLSTPFLNRYFPYTSVILLILVTWVLFKRDKLSLNNIGLNLSKRNLLFLPFGVLIGALAFMLAKYFRSLYTGETIDVTTYSLNSEVILYALYTILPTVAIEELLFRGYAFKKIMDVSNVVIANIIFATLFMLVHILDREVIQNKGMIIFLLITIPVGHLLFATALLKSKTLFFPIGIHLGNNWAAQHLISNYNNGNSIFYIPNTITFDTWVAFIIMIIIWNTFFLIVTYLIWKWGDLLWLKNAKK